MPPAKLTPGALRFAATWATRKYFAGMPALEAIRQVKGYLGLTCAHEWRYYHGVLGYETELCTRCGVDWNDLQEAMGAA